MATSIWRVLQRLVGVRPAAPRDGGQRGVASSASGAVGRGPVGSQGPGATRDVLPAEIRGVHVEYSPNPDGDPDPGEVVWTWVPYEEHDGRGKDRPVLIVGRMPGGAVAGCYLSTKQHEGFVPVGTGGWDPQGRPSYMSPERLLRVTTEGMRREGHVLDRERFARAVAVVAKEYGIGR